MWKFRKIFALPFVEIFSETKLFDHLYLKYKFENALFDAVPDIVGAFCMMQYHFKNKTKRAIYENEFKNCIEKLNNDYKFKWKKKVTKDFLLRELELTNEKTVFDFFNVYLLKNKLSINTKTLKWKSIFKEFSVTNIFKIIEHTCEI